MLYRTKKEAQAVLSMKPRQLRGRYMLKKVKRGWIICVVK